MPSIEQEIKRRRTFAIISHPDAGKTTLTEKLLLFGGAIQQAGAIKAKKNKKYTTSDWMELEKERGVSVSTSVMSFEYKDAIINLLDTPGHADFSEDTYRTLTAVDSVLMVIDAAKGVEDRTRKLMDVCRLRNIPVITFINKLDREGKDPFALLDDVENSLGIIPIPLTWPLGMGRSFQGVYDIRKKSFLSFKEGQAIIPDDKFTHDLEIIEHVLAPFSQQEYLQGVMTPVFFGSGINNFGVRELLDSVLELAPQPLPRPTIERLVDPLEEKLTGLVFKIHANMDPKHRDRIAFMRICSGKFERGMKVVQVRTQRELKVSTPMTFMARDRSVTEEAYPGDIIGIHDTGSIKIGDTFTEGEKLNFTGIPSFAPEIFRRVLNRNPLKTKQLQKGLQQLSEEGAVQLFHIVATNELILGAVGELQFDVVKFRLENEYGAQCAYEPYEAGFAYWAVPATEKDQIHFLNEKAMRIARDTDEQLVYLFKGQWEFPFIQQNFPNVVFYRTSLCTERDKVTH
jgi:peptide chain release factor 3